MRKAVYKCGHESEGTIVDSKCPICGEKIAKIWVSYEEYKETKDLEQKLWNLADYISVELDQAKELSMCEKSFIEVLKEEIDIVMEDVEKK